MIFVFIYRFFENNKWAATSS